MRKQDRKWLDLIAMSRDGQREDLLPPSVMRRLEQSGYVDRCIPHNAVHKERIVINSAGRAALKSAER